MVTELRKVSSTSSIIKLEYIMLLNLHIILSSNYFLSISYSHFILYLDQAAYNFDLNNAHSITLYSLTSHTVLKTVIFINC